MTKPISPSLTEAQWYFLLVKLSRIRTDLCLFRRENIAGLDCGTAKSAAGAQMPTPPGRAIDNRLLAAEKLVAECVAGAVSFAKRDFPRMVIPGEAQIRAEEIV